jgi:hypothetical protein
MGQLTWSSAPKVRAYRFFHCQSVTGLFKKLILSA